MTMVWNWASHFAHYKIICVNAQVRLWGQRVIRAESSGLRCHDFYTPATHREFPPWVSIFVALGNFLCSTYLSSVQVLLRFSSGKLWLLYLSLCLSCLEGKSCPICSNIFQRSCPPTICLDFSLVIWLKGWYLRYLHTEQESNGLWVYLYGIKCNEQDRIWINSYNGDHRACSSETKQAC